jgi:glutaredoxin
MGDKMNSKRCPICNKLLENIKEKMFEMLELDINQDTTAYEIKKKFKELARIHHPDIGGSTEKFQQLNCAKDYLLEELKDQPLSTVTAEEVYIATQRLKHTYHTIKTCPYCGKQKQ